ncbi:hypothetical protein [Halobacillus litoralis]|uniref:hypothetical protein n=1 Tax=Halobacillus litoralis TaxID=45668 RepID=UPI001CFD52F9|nr:hypothetical protein [Halobacillus litoralis]
MEGERTKIIINEIRNWKENRLLPRQYCDFLLALYTQGEKISTQDKQKHLNPFRRLVFISFLVFSSFLLPLSFLVIYFTEMGIIMQTGLLSSFVVLVCTHIWWLKYKKSEWFLVPTIIALLIIMLLSIQVIEQILMNHSILYIAMAVHCFIWIGIGYGWKVKFLTVTGMIGLSLLIISIVL